VKVLKLFLVLGLIFSISTPSFAAFDFFNKAKREERKKQQIEETQKKFQWWPTDAKPGIVVDKERGGYWWWPTVPGEQRPWGNRGYIYVYKIIFDYKAEDKYDEPVAPVEKTELKPSLLIKKIIKNVKIYFDYNKADLREDHSSILDKAYRDLTKNPEARLLVTGNCDSRGSSEYNMKLGTKRAQVVKNYFIQKGIAEDRINIISRGKLDAVSPVKDLVGMQKDRNAQFMVAEVEEVMMPDPSQAQAENAKQVEEGKYIVEKEEKVETEVKVSTKEYVIQKDDSLWKIAAKELGSGHRWKYLYEFNKDRIKNPNKLKAGTTILIPIE
jgi:outer membrane protein OmpA-like peptidoglycan-associated protein